MMQQTTKSSKYAGLASSNDFKFQFNSIEQIESNKSSLLLRNILQNTHSHTLQLFTMIIKIGSIYKSLMLQYNEFLHLNRVYY
jgi:hypothetical protein